MASRDQFAAFWRVLERHLKQGKLETELLPYLRHAGRSGRGLRQLSPGRAGSDESLQERGLISI